MWLCFVVCLRCCCGWFEVAVFLLDGGTRQREVARSTLTLNLGGARTRDERRFGLRIERQVNVLSRSTVYRAGSKSEYADELAKICLRGEFCTVISRPRDIWDRLKGIILLYNTGVSQARLMCHNILYYR
jgi:hypothetical protein